MEPVTGDVIIVDAGEHRTLKRFKKFFLWSSVVMLVGFSFFVGAGWQYRRDRDELITMRHEISELQREQNATTRRLVDAWENVQGGVKLVTSWAEFIKTRDDIISENKRNPIRERVVKNAP